MAAEDVRPAAAAALYINICRGLSVGRDLAARPAQGADAEDATAAESDDRQRLWKIDSSKRGQACYPDEEKA